MDRPYVENYTVDASIFVKFLWQSFLLLFFAILFHWFLHNLFGCVDSYDSLEMFTYVISSFKEQTVDALASGAEEGRSNLR